MIAQGQYANSIFVCSHPKQKWIKCIVKAISHWYDMKLQKKSWLFEKTHLYAFQMSNLSNLTSITLQHKVNL